MHVSPSPSAVCAGDVGSASDPGRKRSSSATKNISLELIYKSGGLEQKVTFSPSVSHSRKHSVDWLRSLKKVRLYDEPLLFQLGVGGA